MELTALETKKDIARKSKLQQLADSRKIKRIEVANKRKESSSSRPVKKTSTKGQPVSDDSPLTSRYRVSRIESIPKQQRKSVKLDDLMRRLAKSEKKLLRQRLMSITPQGLLNDIDTFIHSDRLKNLPDKLLLKELTTGKVTSQTVCKYWQWDSVFASAVIYIESEVAAIDNLTVVPIDSASKGRNLKQPQSSSETNIAAKNKFNSKNINADAYKKRLKKSLNAISDAALQTRIREKYYSAKEGEILSEIFYKELKEHYVGRYQGNFVAKQILFRNQNSIWANGVPSENDFVDFLSKSQANSDLLISALRHLVVDEMESEESAKIDADIPSDTLRSWAKIYCKRGYGDSAQMAIANSILSRKANIFHFDKACMELADKKVRVPDHLPFPNTIILIEGIKGVTAVGLVEAENNIRGVVIGITNSSPDAIMKAKNLVAFINNDCHEVISNEGTCILTPTHQNPTTSYTQLRTLQDNPVHKIEAYPSARTRQALGGTHNSPRPHDVRGHYAWVACGPNHSEHKKVWIKAYSTGMGNTRAAVKRGKVGLVHRVRMMHN